MPHALTVLIAAVAGAVLGHYAFFWIREQGFYAMVLPGGLVGLAASLAGNRRVWTAIVCGVLALATGLVTEWIHHNRDPALGEFILRMFELPGVTLIMIAAGAFLGFWLPYSRADGGEKGSGVRGQGSGHTVG